MRLALTAAAAITPLRYFEDPVVLLEDGLIAAIGPRTQCELPAGVRRLDFPGAVLAPGFIDIHVHGGAGHDVMSAGPDGLAELERHLARHGVTAYVPTTITAPVEETLAALERLALHIEDAALIPPNHTGSPSHAGVARGLGESRAMPIGIHLEGPFISHEKRGVHPPEHIQLPSLELLGRFWEAARERIKLLTIAPELPGALDVIVEAARRGICVSLGHSNADYASAEAGISAGARHATHTFNAMRALDHREPGIAGAVLTDPRVSAEIICDGVHVAPAMVELFLKAKSRDAAVLATDAISAAGMPDGRYLLGSFAVDVHGDRCVSAEGKLAGSVLTLDRAVRNVMEYTHCDLQDAVRLATMNPARIIGLGLSRGALVAGGRADMVVLSPAGEVLNTIVAGQCA